VIIRIGWLFAHPLLTHCSLGAGLRRSLDASPLSRRSSVSASPLYLFLVSCAVAHAISAKE
jgi:hypothetical protein